MSSVTSPVLLIVLWETATFRASLATSQHFRKGWPCLSRGSLQLCRMKVLTRKKKKEMAALFESLFQLKD